MFTLNFANSLGQVKKVVVGAFFDLFMLVSMLVMDMLGPLIALLLAVKKGLRRSPETVRIQVARQAPTHRHLHLFGTLQNT